MKLKTKIIGFMGIVMLLSFVACGAFSVQQYMNASIAHLVENETEKLRLAEGAFSQVGTREDFDNMGELARDAYLRYQFKRCYREGYGLMKGETCIENLTEYEIVKPSALEQGYAIQEIDGKYVLMVRQDFEYPADFWVMSVKDITSTWREARNQALFYFDVFFVVFALSMGILTVAVTRILSALEELQRQAEAIENGDFTSRVQVRTRDEIGELASRFNRMSERIRRQIEDLEFLLGAMAHEMKTPVTNIMGYADTLLHVRLSEKQKEQSLDAIHRSAGRLSQMSDKLMQLVRFYDKQELAMEMVDIPEVIRWVYSEQKERLKEKGIIWELEERDFKARGDKMLLISLFGNLVTNSIKAIEGDGNGKIQIVIDGASGTVQVMDNGCGIPKEDLSQVKKAFYMVDKSRSRREQGAGLGLALAERIIKAHHGSMEIESVLGKGTRVTVRFPLHFTN